MANPGTALVLGATGGLGGAAARALARAGWRIRALNRDPEAARAKRQDLEWIAGDAMAADDVRNASEAADLIVHGVNPKGYRDWDTLVLPMLDNTIAAARGSRATILFPSNLYNYGPDAFPIVTEDSPQNPVTRKGRIRVEMERRLALAACGGVRTILLRCGDYFGPEAGNNWFLQALVKPRKPLASITYPGDEGIGHQWAYLPDVAETFVRLVERADELPTFAGFNMASQWDPDGTAMIAAIRQAAGKPDLPVKPFPWRLITLASPFVTMFREIVEMRYLWQQPVRLDNRRLLELLGSEPRTPLVEAVRATLIDAGCIRS